MPYYRVPSYTSSTSSRASLSSTSPATDRNSSPSSTLQDALDSQLQPSPYLSPTATTPDTAPTLNGQGCVVVPRPASSVSARSSLYTAVTSSASGSDRSFALHPPGTLDDESYTSTSSSSSSSLTSLSTFTDPWSPNLLITHDQANPRGDRALAKRSHGHARDETALLKRQLHRLARDKRATLRVMDVARRYAAKKVGRRVEELLIGLVGTERGVQRALRAMRREERGRGASEIKKIDGGKGSIKEDGVDTGAVVGDDDGVGFRSVGKGESMKVRRWLRGITRS